MPGFNPGGSTGGLFGGNLGGGLSGAIGGGGGGFSFGDAFSGIGDFLGSDKFGGALDLGSLALNTYGLNKSLGFQEDQLGILKDQENRAATAQNFQTGNSLAMALQTTTPGTPEHARIQEAMAQGTFQV
jgi:hypothetical protein